MVTYGWEEDPPDGLITRARTKLGQLRIWHFQKDGITQVNGLDFAGPLSHPGIYILYQDEEKSAYIGETSDLRKRLGARYRGGPRELRNWSHVIVLNDGRSYAQSIFTNATLRTFLEKSVIQHISEGGLYHVVNKVKEKPQLSVAIKVIAENLDRELLYILEKMRFVKPGVEPATLEEQILHPQLRKMLEKNGYHIKRIVRDRWIVDGKTFFERSGTAPRASERGWHITLRIKPRETIWKEEGALLISRGLGYLIPAKQLKDWLRDELWPIKPGKEAIDIYADLRTEHLLYKVGFPKLNLAKFRLLSLEKV